MDGTQRNTPWFSGSLHHWDGLLEPHYLIHIDKGATVYQRGEEIDHVCIVKTGRLKLVYVTDAGEEKAFFFCLPGAVFDLDSVFRPSAHFLQVVALEDCSVYQIPSAVFLDYLLQDPQRMTHAMETTVMKTNMALEHVRRLCFLNAQQRIAITLVDLVYAVGVDTPRGRCIQLDITQQDLADIAKTSRLTVNKTIVALTKSGVVSKWKSRFYIHNVAKLEQLSMV